MKEADLRKWHRRMGIVLALFIILQAGTGLILSLEDLGAPDSDERTGNAVSTGPDQNSESAWEQALKFIHHEGETSGAVYRILLGIGMVAMAISGSTIFFKIRSRSKHR